VLGYVFWQSFDQLTQYVSRGLFAFGTVVAVLIALVGLVQLRRDEEKRRRARAWLDRHERNRALRPLVRLAGPAWRVVGRPTAGGADLLARFGWNRLTPGRLGLELTTLVALFAVGTFAFFFLGHMSEPGIDAIAADVSSGVTADPLVDVVKIVTELGALPTVAFAAALTAGWAVTRDRWIEAAALVIGVPLSYLAIATAKAAYGRVRPEDMLIEVSGTAYPSGHTLYAVTLVACAVVLVRAGSGWAVRFAAVTVAIAAVVLVALTRVYLRVHYLTDVLGGAALGAALWALLGVIALVAGHVRHNGRRRG
jgi:membrane-associated phospholipid phosphatase